MKTGEHGEFFIIEWSEDDSWNDLGSLIERFPELVEGRSVGIVSWNSWDYKPTSEEQIAGWFQAGMTTFIPMVVKASELPVGGWDEWYVFDDEPEPVELKAYVNYQGFSPVSFGWVEELSAFWDQALRMHPLHIIGDGLHMYLITRDKALYGRVCAA